MGITPAELWEKDPEQIDLMVAFTSVERETGSHGMPMSEATDPKADPTYYAEGSFGYQATLVPDWAQHAIEMERKRLRDGNPDIDLSYYQAVVERVDYS